MSFVIVRMAQGQRKYPEYVAEPGSNKSFTPHKSRARRYLTLAEAEADRCPDNEWVDTI